MKERLRGMDGLPLERTTILDLLPWLRVFNLLKFDHSSKKEKERK